MSKKEVYEYIKKRDNLIRQAEKRLLGSLSILERALFDKIIEEFIDKFSIDKGFITNNGKNLNLTSAIDKIVDDFRRNNEIRLLNSYLSDISGIVDLTTSYFGKVGFKKELLIQARKDAQGFIKARLGINAKGEMINRGFLDNFIKDKTLANTIKNKILTAVTNGERFTKLQMSLAQTLTGTSQTEGALKAYWRGNIFDTYQQLDRAVADSYADTLELQCAIYAGGLIETSRQFCIEKDGKVFTREEMNKWKDDKNLPKTKDEKQSGVVIDYNPFIDAGRWNCRHNLNWISNELAIQLRPDLKRKLTNKIAA